MDLLSERTNRGRSSAAPLADMELRFRLDELPGIVRMLPVSGGASSLTC